MKVHTRWPVVIATALIVSTLLGACGVMKPVRARRTEAVQTGFLGDYSELAPREGFEAQQVYVNPTADWPSYDRLFIESVTLWVNPDMELSDEDQQMLTDMLYASLSEKLGEKFELVDAPGPGVVKLRFALTQAQGANQAMNTITTVIPQGRLVSTVVGVGADTAKLVGSASVEGEAQDGITNERLAAVVDSRAGTKGVTRMLSKWADVEAICDYWGERVTEFFVSRGVRQKT